jgi:hypothetical protein
MSYFLLLLIDTNYFNDRLRFLLGLCFPIELLVRGQTYNLFYVSLHKFKV